MASDNSIPRSRLVPIVDDENDIVTLFRDALGKLDGIAIFAFTDPVLALEHCKLNKQEYVLVISDLRRPGLNGLKLINEVKKMNQFVRTILMTAFAIDDDLFQEYAKMGLVNGFLQKPIRLDQLRAEATSQLHNYEFQKQRSLIKIKD